MLIQGQPVQRHNLVRGDATKTNARPSTRKVVQKAGAKPDVPRLSARALEQEAKKKAEASEAARVAKLSEFPFPLTHLPHGLQACVLERLPRGEGWQTMVSKASRGLRALIHSGQVRAVDCARIAATAELRVARESDGGLHPLEDPSRQDA